MAHAPAFDFAKNHQLPEQAADKSNGITQLGPAHRILPGAVGGDMLVGFAGVVPEKLSVIETRVSIKLEMHRFDLSHAFQAVQMRASAKHGCGVGLGPALSYHPCIAGT